MRELERDLPTESATPRGQAVRSTVPSELAIVGAGRVGGSIAAAAIEAGLDVDLAGRAEAAGSLGRHEVALLCVPDSAIGALAELAAKAPRTPRLVGHTSGARGLDALEPAARAGAATFSLHPLQTIPDASTELAGSPCAISGSDDGAARFARELALRLGMRPFVVEERHRAAYHAAASIASNFLVALEESATDLLGRLGVDAPRELLSPLVLSSAANWSERGPAALTGPIARGDAETVAAHLAALRETAPELIDLYSALAERTRELAR